MTRAEASTGTTDASPAGFGAMRRGKVLAASGLKLLLCLQVARTALRLGFLAATAALVGGLVMGAEIAPATVLAAPALLVAAALAGLACDRVQARTELDVAAGLRKMAGEALRGMDARTLQSIPTGTLTMSMQRHPPAVAALVTGHRAATMMMGTGPLMAAAALFAVSWQAALLLLALTPLMIVFFVLVGQTIRTRADVQERTFGKLAGQFADRMRTLPTILANHALAGEERKLADRLQSYAANTMSVLRIAFLNAGIIDFFASLSIAMLAVFLGLGHLKLAMIPGFSNLELWQSLFILMIAPDYFAPFRRFSEQYHAKAEGLAAAAALDRLLASAGRETVDLPAVDRVLRDLKLPARGLVVVAGPSGSGKSTLLRRIAGVEKSAGPALIGDVAWISADSFVPQGSLAAAIAWNAKAAREQVARAAAKVGLLDDALLPGGLAAAVAVGGANLSGGQRLRLAVARAMLGERTILADEPTAKLDPATAASIRICLRDIADSRLVLVASHDRDLVALADRVIDLQVARGVEAA